MINLINSIGQRKVSKILFLCSLNLSILSFVLQEGFLSLLTMKAWAGVFLMSAPVLLLSKAAHKTKDFRFFCLVSQLTIIILNVALYFFNIPDFFFIITILELIATALFTFLFAKKPVKKVIKKTKTKTVTQDEE